MLNHRPQQQHPVPTPRKLPPASLTSNEASRPNHLNQSQQKGSTPQNPRGRWVRVAKPIQRPVQSYSAPSSAPPQPSSIGGGRSISTGRPGGSAQGVWLGMRGIDVCLRMFTAVEVLDGENMVGCRMCQIANEVDLKGNELRDREERTLKHASPLSPPPVHQCPCPRPR